MYLRIGDDIVFTVPRRVKKNLALFFNIGEGR